jgi:UDP-glucuronate 4-epimerase
MATYRVTGSVWVIGAKVTELILANAHTVARIDDLNDAYDARLKQWRLKWHGDEHDRFIG